MKIKTTIEAQVTVWERHEIIVEVESVEEFNELKEKNLLHSNAIEWSIIDTMWETIDDTGNYDNYDSEIIEIIEEK